MISDKTIEKSLDQAALASIVQHVAEFMQSQPNAEFVIGHGAGSFAHPQTKKLLKNIHNLSTEEINKEVIAIKNNLKELNNYFIQEFNRHDIDLNQFQTLHGDLWYQNDVLLVKSTEELFLELLETGKYSQTNTHIYLLTRSESVIIDQKICSKIELSDLVNLTDLNQNNDATGGIISKVQFAFQLKKYAHKVMIGNRIDEGTEII